MKNTIKFLIVAAVALCVAASAPFTLDQFAAQFVANARNNQVMVDLLDAGVRTGQFTPEQIAVPRSYWAGRVSAYTDAAQWCLTVAGGAIPAQPVANDATFLVLPVSTPTERPN